LPAMLKKTAVSASDGTSTSPVDVFESTTCSCEPTMSKLTVAANPPELPVNSTGAATAFMLTAKHSAEALLKTIDLMGEQVAEQVQRG